MNYVLYHHNCFDGFGAAWACNHFFQKAGINDVEYLPCKYGDPFPKLAEGKHNIYMVDFSFPRAVLEQTAASHDLVVLDHHKTAEANCKGLDFCIFDMDRSGASLTWDYFFPNTPRPILINIIEDRDLWRFKLQGCKQLHAWVASYEKSFPNFDAMHITLESEGGRVLAYNEGSAILRADAQKVDEMCREAQWVELEEGVKVPAVNCPYHFGSNVGERLCQLYPEALYAAYYFDRADGEQQWGLRSTGYDVSAVAKKLGGGGHQRASGFVKGKVTA